VRAGSRPAIAFERNASGNVELSTRFAAPATDTNEMSSSVRLCKCVANASSIGKPSMTQAIVTGARNGTVTVWYGTPPMLMTR
jgi:hypothetical protein